MDKENKSSKRSYENIYGLNPNNMDHLCHCFQEINLEHVYNVPRKRNKIKTLSPHLTSYLNDKLKIKVQYKNEKPFLLFLRPCAKISELKVVLSQFVDLGEWSCFALLLLILFVYKKMFLLLINPFFRCHRCRSMGSPPRLDHRYIPIYKQAFTGSWRGLEACVDFHMGEDIGC